GGGGSRALRKLDAAKGSGGYQPGAYDQEQLAESEQADAEHLPGEQMHRPDRREDHLDDPRRLLLDDAAGDHVAEPEDRDVQQQAREERDPAAACLTELLDRERLGVERALRGLAVHAGLPQDALARALAVG